MIHTYAQAIRRELHRHPGVGFDLDETLAILRRELDRIGVEYTDRFGRSSLVATVNPEKTAFTIGIRADIDALPITEQNDIPFRSENDGKMHACGHDVHAAVALATLKELHEMRDRIACRVKFIFQAAEEGLCGAKYMTDDGVMDDIDCVVALHCDVNFPVGSVAMSEGYQDANSNRIEMVFYGKNSHAARQHRGVDAIMAAVRAYTAVEFMVAKEVDAREVALINAGEIHGGSAANIVADRCEIKYTLRTWDEKVNSFVVERMRAIAEAEAASCGATAEVTHSSFYPAVFNAPAVTAAVRESAVRVLGAEKVLPKTERGLGGEDFSYFARQKPGCMFRLGVRNEEKGYTSGGHTATFMVDEECYAVGVSVFKQFVLDHMNGLGTEY